MVDILPVKDNTTEETKQFLQSVIKICLDFIIRSNDRKEKVLEFHQPNELWGLYDFNIPSEPVNIEQLLKDCSECLKYQVKTGEYMIHALFPLYVFQCDELLQVGS